MANRKNVDKHESAMAQYGAKLRGHRDARAWSGEALANRVGCDPALISKIETAAQPATLPMSQQFDDIFDLDEYFEDLWWLVQRERAHSVEALIPFTEYEERAVTIHSFTTVILPGLLQTEEYATAVVRPWWTPEETTRRVAARTARQAILEKANPPMVVALIAEYAIRRTLGGHQVMRRQLAHLIELAGRPNSVLQVVPESAPAYSSVPFLVMSMPDGPDVGYVESPATVGAVTKAPEQVRDMKVLFDQLRAMALTEADSVRLIKEVMEAL